MSASQSSDGSGSSFSTGDASSVHSDNSNAEALNALYTQQHEDGDDLDQNDKGPMDVVFGMIYTLTKNKSINTSLRVAALQLVVEFLQFFLILFNTTKAWHINTDFPLYKAIEWVLFRTLLARKGYTSYMTLFYILAVVSTVGQGATIWVALRLRGGEVSSKGMARLTGVLQMMAFAIFTFWPTLLDYYVFLFDCHWPNLASGGTAYHMTFQDKNCLALPHLGHMLYAGFGLCNFSVMIVLWTVGVVDMNPLTRSLLASSDIGTMFRITALKLLLVVVGAALDSVPKIQAILIVLAVDGIAYFIFYQLPYYVTAVNMIYQAIWGSLLGLACLLLGLVFTLEKHTADPGYRSRMTMAVLYLIFPMMLMGSACVRLRMRMLKPAAEHLRRAYTDRKAAVEMSDQQKKADAAAGKVGSAADNSTAVTLLGDLKGVYRFKDVTQLSVLCRAMRNWDEDGVPDPDAAEYGEFLLKCGMARMPNNPIVLVMYASLLMQMDRDGQAAHTTLQLAQKANTSVFERMQIYMAQHLEKNIKRGGEGLDLLGYVEYQRNYRACIKTHKAALLAQRQFWNSLLRDTVRFVDLQKTLKVMAKAEDKATSTYRRVLERYPNNGKLLKIYGRFLEYVRNDPWTAAKYYAEASKYGTSESLLTLAQGQNTTVAGGSNNLASATGTVNERVDGLMIINSSSQIMMVNAAALALFGYGKGELEGKGLPMLMPQPWAQHHNSFLDRYIVTGVPHVLDRTRTMVGLHKDRSVFPFSLLAMKLSGMGTDTLFLGVLRRTPASRDNTAVRFWTTASGLIMSADNGTEGMLGVAAPSLVGQQIANLFTNSDEVQSFVIKTAASRVESEAGYKTQASMLHAYLPAVVVELTVQFGGAIDESDCRFLIIEARPVSEATAVMALNQKGRLVYVTDKLAAMLGYSIANMAKMDLNLLMPPPYGQMHGTWLKALDRRPGPASCRSGAVVNLLAANGAKVPVTLKMSIKESADNSGLLHIVQAEKATDAQLLDQRCLLLTINHKGTILDVNSGVPKRLFNFNPADVIGRPVASIVDVFGYWRNQFGSDASLYTLLAVKSMQDALPATNNSSHRAIGTSWRVGVHIPVKRDEDIAAEAAEMASRAQKEAQGNSTILEGDSILTALRQHNRLLAACMNVALLETEGRLLEDPSGTDMLPVMQVALYRSDALTSIIELDKELKITHSDEALSLMFGVSERKLHKKHFPELVGLPASTTFADLLGLKVVKKGAMKATSTHAAAAVTAHMGHVRKVVAHHLEDGKPMTLEMQAMSHQQSGKRRILIHMKLQEPSSASFPALLKLSQAASSTGGPQEPEQNQQAVISNAAVLAEGESSESDEDVGSVKRGAVGGPADGEKTENGRSRISEWVQSTGGATKVMRGSCDLSDMRESNGYYEAEPEAAAYVTAAPRSKDAADYDGPGFGRKPVKKSMPLERAGNDDGSASIGQGSLGQGSTGQGSGGGGDAASEAGDRSASEAGGGMSGHEEDLTIDASRAKRLKKLHRMLFNNVATNESRRWRTHTMVLMAIIVAAHVTSYVVLTTAINARYSTAYKVSQMAGGIDKMLATVMRSVMIQRCYLPKWKGTFLCSDAQMTIYYTKFQQNIDLAHMFHQNLYLGQGKLQQFADPRLVEYWTHYMLPEQVYNQIELMPSGKIVNGSIETSARPLWEMGNVLISYARDVIFNAKTWKSTMTSQPEFQYLILNDNSVFSGYAWSLDTLVDYAWKDLLKVSGLLLALLIVEVLLIQLTCLLYEFYLLLKCNVAHAKLFSVFLALPSATVRIMTQRQIQIDEDMADEGDEDDMDLDAVDAGGVTTNTAAGEARTGAGAEEFAAVGDKKDRKSVRMSMDMADEDAEIGEEPADTVDDRRSRRVSGNNTDRSGRRSRKAGSEGKNKKQRTGFAKFKHDVYKKLFGWMDPRFHRNGKKLEGNSFAVWQVMIPLTMWLVLLIAISCVSYESLRQLQSPLVSLDTATHVLYYVSFCRVYSHLLAFANDATEKAYARGILKGALQDLRSEYTTLLYGGRMKLKANVSFVPIAPAGVFEYGPITDLLFRTKDCLRRSQRELCYNDPTNAYYSITHAGLDAIMNRYIDQMVQFANLPDNASIPSDSGYIFAHKVGANDLSDGVQTAGDLFLQYTIERFQAVKRLHMALLIVSLTAALLFFIVLYRPYIKKLHRDSKAVVGMLSQLPAEVDVEGHVKSIILGVTKQAEVGAQSLLVGPSGGSMMIMPPGPGPFGAPPGPYPPGPYPPGPYPPPVPGRFGSQPGTGMGPNPNMYSQGSPAGYNSNSPGRWGPPPGPDYVGRGSAPGWQGQGGGPGKRGGY